MKKLFNSFLVFAFLISLLLTIAPLSQAQTKIRLGILGDSSEDEYRADDNRAGGTQWAATTLNWTELLHHYGKFDLGTWGTRSEPRRTGFEYSWSRSGAEAHDIVTSGALPGIVGQITQGKIDVVYFTIGNNDFAYYRDGALIYNGTISGQTLQNKINSINSDITTTVTTLLNADPNLPIVLGTIADPGQAPNNIAQFPDASKRLRVSNAINAVNQTITQLAQSDERVTLFDVQEINLAIASRLDQNGNIRIGSELILFSLGDEPHHAILSDGIHAGTAINGIYANFVMDKINLALGSSVSNFTDQEILSYAGLSDPLPTPSLTPVLTSSPTTTPSATLEPTSIPNSCPSDINQDSVTDITDYSIMLLDYLKPSFNNPRSDINQDGVVDISDYVIILQNFLVACN